VDGKRESKNNNAQIHTKKKKKKKFSIVLMEVVNSNYEFIMADAGINGRISVGGVLGNTVFGKALVDKLLQIPEPGTLPNSEKKLLFVFVVDDSFADRKFYETLWPNRNNCRITNF
jgi:hypothetical protein